MELCVQRSTQPSSRGRAETGFPLVKKRTCSDHGDEPSFTTSLLFSLRWPQRETGRGWFVIHFRFHHLRLLVRIGIAVALAISTRTLHSKKGRTSLREEKSWVDVGVSQPVLERNRRFALFRKHWRAVPQMCPRRHRRQAPGRRFDLLETVHRWVCWTTSISDPLSMVPPTMRVPPSA